MDPATAAKIAQIAIQQVKDKEKRQRILVFVISIVFLALFLFSTVVYTVTHPLDAIFGAHSYEIQIGNESSVAISNYSKVEDAVWQFLKDIGFNDYGAAGTMGNMKIESAFNTAANHNNHYFGLCQWGGGRWQGNPLSLSSFAEMKGTDWTNLQTQLSYFDIECRTSYKKVYEQMRTATSVQYATDYFCTYYEICPGQIGNWAYSMVNGQAYQCLADRRKYAEYYYKHYAAQIAER